MLAFPIPIVPSIEEEDEDYFFHDLFFMVPSSVDKSILSMNPLYNWRVLESFVVVDSASIKYSTSFSSTAMNDPIRKKFKTIPVSLIYYPPKVPRIDLPYYYNRDNVLWTESLYVITISDVVFMIALETDPIVSVERYIHCPLYWYNLNNDKWYIKLEHTTWDVTIKPKLIKYKSSHRIKNVGFIAPWGKDSTDINNKIKTIILNIITSD